MQVWLCHMLVAISSAAANEKSWVAQQTTQLVHWVVHTNFGWSNIKILKNYAYFDCHTSNMAASSGTIGHGLWQNKFLGFHSDQYLVISGSPDLFIGRTWRPGDCLAAALHFWTTILVPLYPGHHRCRWVLFSFHGSGQLCVLPKWRRYRRILCNDFRHQPEIL